MKINIVGLNKADVLINLYNNACCGGLAFASHPFLQKVARLSPPANPSIVERVLKDASVHNNYYFDYVDLGGGSKPLKVDLAGFEFDSTNYDHYNGEGLAKSIITRLRRKVVEEYYNHANKDSFAYLLSKIGSAVEAEEQKTMDKETSNNSFKPTI